MKIKLIALVLLGAGVIAVGLVRTGSTVHKKPLPPYKDRLKSLAKEAKSEGRKKIGVPTGSPGTPLIYCRSSNPVKQN